MTPVPEITQDTSDLTWHLHKVADTVRWRVTLKYRENRTHALWLRSRWRSVLGGGLVFFTTNKNLWAAPNGRGYSAPGPQSPLSRPVPPALQLPPPEAVRSAMSVSPHEARPGLSVPPGGIPHLPRAALPQATAQPPHQSPGRAGPGRGRHTPGVPKHTPRRRD